MLKVPVTILYEDQRGPTQGFSLHSLVKSCVFDVVDGERRTVEEALRDGRPLKGVGNLIRACRDDIDLIAPDGRSVVAVFDNDKIREQLKLPRDASDERVKKEILKGCRAPDLLSIILLRENTESVLHAAALCASALERARVERAIKHKDLLERDAILAELSKERERPIRACILEKMPSLRVLIDLLVKKVRAVRYGRRRRER